VRRDHNGRPEIRLSELRPTFVSVVNGDRPMVLCPDGCGKWIYVQRGKLRPHHARHPGQCPGRSECEVTRQTRCSGSGQRVKIDLTPKQHRALLYKIRHAADDRRRTPVHGVRPAPVLPPVCRIGRVAA
jgi:hypothetical protein